MYTFSIKKDMVPILEITMADEMTKENLYLQSLVEKCFERVFRLIRGGGESSEEVDSEDEN